MPCDTMQTQTKAQLAERASAIAELAEQIASGEVAVRRNRAGKITGISGHAGSRAAEAGWCEACALRKLRSMGVVRDTARDTTRNTSRTRSRVRGR